jgi:hypothetical protein
MKPGEQYCSKSCYTASRQVQKVCQRCGKDFTIPRSRAEGNRGTYCSKVCKEAGVIMSCDTCGQVFRAVDHEVAAGRRYCSYQCHYKAHGREPYPIGDGVIAIPLTRGKVAVIDAQDLPLAEKYSWCARRHRNTTYAQSGRGYLHALIMETPEGMVTDHINGNGLDNRRQNLRVVTNQENLNNMHMHRTRRRT